eukprot:scaffold10829_cov129-Isochrysis_galbana.AAC.2
MKKSGPAPPPAQPTSPRCISRGPGWQAGAGVHPVSLLGGRMPRRVPWMRKPYSTRYSSQAEHAAAGSSGDASRLTESTEGVCQSGRRRKRMSPAAVRRATVERVWSAAGSGAAGSRQQAPPLVDCEFQTQTLHARCDAQDSQHSAGLEKTKPSSTWPPALTTEPSSSVWGKNPVWLHCEGHVTVLAGACCLLSLATSAAGAVRSKAGRGRAMR